MVYVDPFLTTIIHELHYVLEPEFQFFQSMHDIKIEHHCCVPFCIQRQQLMNGTPQFYFARKMATSVFRNKTNMQLHWILRLLLPTTPPSYIYIRSTSSEI